MGQDPETRLILYVQSWAFAQGKGARNFRHALIEFMRPEIEGMKLYSPVAKSQIEAMQRTITENKRDDSE